jgi:hypothetical protein
MARKVTAVRGPQTVTEIDLTNPTGVPQQNSFVRLDRLAALSNQRLYRQHMTYYGECTLQTDGTQSLIEVYTLPTNWWTLGALRMAKKMHDRAMKEERGTSGQARWYDFRIAGVPPQADELVPAGLDIAGNRIAVSTSNSEYLFSTVEDNAGNAKTFSWVDPTGSTRYNVFDEWDAMGNISDDPTTPTAGGYDDIDGAISSDNQNRLLDRGNLPPYDGDTHNLRFVKVGELYQTAGGAQSLSTGLFAAPLGIVFLKGYSTTQGDNVRVMLAPGEYKGVMASAI